MGAPAAVFTPRDAKRMQAARPARASRRSEDTGAGRCMVNPFKGLSVNVRLF